MGGPWPPPNCPLILSMLLWQEPQNTYSNIMTVSLAESIRVADVSVKNITVVTITPFHEIS